MFVVISESKLEKQITYYDIDLVTIIFSTIFN